MATPTPPGFVIKGTSWHPLRDLYHLLLARSWAWLVSFITAVYLVANALFALVYMHFGGVQNLPQGDFLAAYGFSVETMSTIGYGDMYPVGHAAHALVTAEAIFGLLLTAIVTGLAFTKFSRTSAVLVFSEKAVITPMDGMPALMFRLGNDRGNVIMDAKLRVTLVRTERTAEGSTFYRMYDLPLTREVAPNLRRSWTCVHLISDESPLKGVTPRHLKDWEAELLVTVSGTDDISLQPVHGQYTYDGEADVLFGHKLVDVLSELPDGKLQLDLTRFHSVEKDSTATAA